VDCCETGNILSEEGGGRWEQTLDIDLRAQMMGTRLAALAMQKYGSKGVFLPSNELASMWPHAFYTCVIHSCVRPVWRVPNRRSEWLPLV